MKVVITASTKYISEQRFSALIAIKTRSRNNVRSRTYFHVLERSTPEHLCFFINIRKQKRLYSCLGRYICTEPYLGRVQKRTTDLKAPAHV